MTVVIAAMIAAMMLLVLYSRRLFEENRTRVTRRAVDTPVVRRPAGELNWRTLVDPATAANRSRASGPVARAMSAVDAPAAAADSRAA